jgi:hypothetical protein
MQYILPAEAIIVVLAAIAGFFIKRWMDNFDSSWRKQMEGLEKRYDTRFDKIEAKLDKLVHDRTDYITRQEFLSEIARIHTRFDDMNAIILEQATRISVLEGLQKSKGL